MIKKLIFICASLANGLMLIGGAGETATPDQLSQAIGGYTQALTAQLTDLTVQRAGWAKNVFDLRAAMVALERKHAGLTAAIDQATRAKEAEETALQDTRAKHAQTGREKTALAASTGGLGTAVADLSGRLREENIAIERLKKEIADLLAKQSELLELMKGEHDAAHRDLLAQHQAEFYRLGKQLENLEKELADLRNQYTSASASLAQKKAELEKKTTVLVGLTKTHEELIAKATKTGVALTRHTENLAALQAEKDRLDKQLTNLRLQLKTAQEGFNAYQKTVGEGINKLVAQVTAATTDLARSAVARPTVAGPVA